MTPKKKEESKESVSNQPLNCPPYKVGWKGQIYKKGLLLGSTYHGEVVEVGDDYIIFHGGTFSGKGSIKEENITIKISDIKSYKCLST